MLVLIPEDSTDETIERALWKAVQSLRDERPSKSTESVPVVGEEQPPYTPSLPLKEGKDAFRPRTVGDCLFNVWVSRQQKNWENSRILLRKLRKCKEIHPIELSPGPKAVEQKVLQILKKNDVKSPEYCLTMLRLIFDDVFPCHYERVSKVKLGFFKRLLPHSPKDDLLLKTEGRFST